MPKFVMSDGRSFTSYQPSCQLNADLQEKYKVKNSHEFRYYLQKNAEAIMKDNISNSDKMCTLCPVCKSALEWKPSPE